MKTIIFDLDGTLIDSSYRHLAVLEDAIVYFYGSRQNDYECSDYLSYKFCGNTTYDYLTKILGIEKKRAMLIDDYWKMHIEDEKYLTRDVLFQDTLSTLNALQGKYQIIYLTARNNSSNILEETKKLSIFGFADDFYCVNPKNAVEEKSKVILNYNKSDVIIVGDTEIEYTLALNLGICSYILNRGFRSKKFWEEKNVITHDSLRDLLTILCD